MRRVSNHEAQAFPRVGSTSILRDAAAPLLRMRGNAAGDVASSYPTKFDAEFTRGPNRMSGVSSSTVLAPT